MYETVGCVSSFYEYGHDLCDNVVEFFLPNTTTCEETIFCVVGTYIRYPFLCCEIPKQIPQKPFFE